MKKNLMLSMMLVLVAVLTSCSSKMNELSSDYFTVSPEVLEAVAGQVPATINGQFPEKYFNKNSVVTVLPVLKWNGGQALGQPATFQGEKVEGNNRAISYKLGGSYTMKTVFDYKPEMAKSELFLEITVTKGGKMYKLPAVKVADGVISTSELLSNTVGSANMTNSEDAFQRIIRQTEKRDIMFMIQQANIRSSERKVASEFNDAVKTIEGTENRKVNNIEVSAYASPDGTMDLNTKLAAQRESNTGSLVNSNLKRSKLETPVDTKYTAEDWDGFKELVEASNIQDKDLILRVLAMYSDPDKRDQEIKNISTVYDTLAKDILPQLRRSRLVLNYDVIGKSDEEIANLAENDAKALNLEELLYAATLTDQASEKASIYTKATKLFSDDYRAYNNLGMLAFEAGDLNMAANCLNDAASRQAAPEVQNNKALVALAEGNVVEAENCLSKASGAATLQESLGNLAVAKGDYDEAVANFGDVKTNSAALAQILAKDYSKAQSTLNGIANPDAMTSYLAAILGARTNNASMVASSLKKATEMDSSLVEKAKNDIEFAKYAVALAGI
ncbi:MAG: hypothetical protein WCR36_07550 [Bacteroidaceae bacterium]